MWLKRFFSRNEDKGFDPSLVLDDVGYSTVFAIGDVHGCLDLAKKVERHIFGEMGAGTDTSSLLIYLGDVIDRGPQSAQFIEHFLSPTPSGFKRQLIAGNHEVMFRSFLAAPSKGRKWMAYGGRETLESYGISREQMSIENLEYLVGCSIPEEHQDLLKRLPPYLVWNGFVFAHSGLDTQRYLSEQTAERTSTVRPNYDEQYHTFGKRVVHGHRIVEKPTVCDFDISLDTGAYATGRLSYAKLKSNGCVELNSISL
jgi:serine/threonine protein phosphatase 1